MKKRKINIGIIAAFVIIALLNQCESANVVRKSKVSENVKFYTVDVKLEDVLSKPANNITPDLTKNYIKEVPKTR